MTHHFNLPSSFPYRPLIGAVLLWTGALSASSAQEQPGQEIVVRRPPAPTQAVAATQAVADFTTCALPAWPKAALREEQQGTVTLAFLIGVDGAVRDTKLLKSSGFPLLDMAAQEGIAKCRFAPGTKAGQPVEAWMSMQYVWSLKETGKNTPAIIAAARQGAERGVAADQYNLGLAYLNGDGVPRSIPEGLKWMRAAGKQGHAKAQEAAALVLQKDLEGSPANLVESAAWMRKAAEQGLARAQYMLGSLLVSGRGMSADPAEGVQWMRKSAEQGDPVGQTALAVQLLKENPDPARAAEALAWLGKAVAQNYDVAQAVLGECLERGIWVTRDYAAAAALYDKASRHGNRVALNRLAVLYELGQGVPVDTAKAKQLRAAAERKLSTPPQ